MTAFSLFKYISVLKEKNDLSHQLKTIKEQITVLENEKQALILEVEKERQIGQQLSQENSGLKENLKTAQEKLTQFDAELTEAKSTLDKLSSEFTAVKAESIALKEQEAQFKAAIEERDTLKERINSIAELKKMIKELKYKMRQEKRQIRRIIKPVEKKDKKAEDADIEGNQGFVVKEGQSTYQVRIEVNPIEEKITKEPKAEDLKPEEPKTENTDAASIQPTI